MILEIPDLHEVDANCITKAYRFLQFVGKRMTTNSYIGSSLDELLEEDGILHEVEAIAIKRVLAWQIKELMQEKGITKTEMAQKMNISRASLDRFLDPKNTSVTLNTMVNAAKAVGKRLRIELV